MVDGYDLMLKCTGCGLMKRIPDFPMCGAFALGSVLSAEHHEVWERGCLRCGVCRFTVESIPPPPPKPAGPVGWSDKKE